MPLGYTQYIEDEYWGYLERTAIQAKRTIENVDAYAAREEWKKQIEDLGKEYTCTARFFLMAYVYENFDKISEDEEKYVCSYRGKKYEFHKVSVGYAQELPDQERDSYLELLTAAAADNHGDKKGVWRPLMKKAMLRNKRIELLSRRDGFRIAHGLEFSYEQAERFLIAVLDNDGFLFTRAEDIIEAFCFLYEPYNDYYIAEQIKEEYREKTAHISKQDMEMKPEYFTKDIAVSLAERIVEWKTEGEEDIKASFLEWLIEKAAFLDLPGKSAYKLYCNFAGYAYQMIQNHKVSVNDRVNDPYHMVANERHLYEDDLFENICEEDFTDTIRNACINTEYKVKEDQIYTIASELVQHASLEFDNPQKRRADTAWRYLTVDRNGKITAKGIGSRIPKLLKGEEPVSKADLLFILWQVCELLWMEKRDFTETLVFDRIAGFWYCAEETLEKAMLPRFYAPHILERSFLNAICAETIETDYPFEVYEGMCEYVLQSAKKEKTGKAVLENEQKQRKDENHSNERKKCLTDLKKATEEMYKSQGDCHMHEGVGDLLLKHFLENAVENMQYVFTKEGIYFEDSKATIKNPNRQIIISYPDRNTGKCFDPENASYDSVESMKERFQFVYGLELYIRDKTAMNKKELRFQIHYRKKVSLKIKKCMKKGAVG